MINHFVKYQLASTLLGSVLLLAGCAGTNSEFECNATTSDSCMTIEQANEKAKLREETATGKPGVVALPVLAKGDFSTASMSRITPVTPPTPRIAAVLPPSVARPTAISLQTHAVQPVARTQVNSCAAQGCWSVDQNRPTRIGERTAQLWIAPWIDSQDVYHQPGNVFFVVSSSAWGQPRSAY